MPKSCSPRPRASTNVVRNASAFCAALPVNATAVLRASVRSITVSLSRDIQRPSRLSWDDGVQWAAPEQPVAIAAQHRYVAGPTVAAHGTGGQQAGDVGEQHGVEAHPLARRAVLAHEED